MVFGSFTGKDNHGKCVTFAVALLTRENVKSFVRLFNNFKECMGKPPKLMITDQDPATKIAMEKVMEGTKHRFCMWHIMFKVSDHLSNSLKQDHIFAKKFNSIVWFELIEPHEFEEKWNQIMVEYGLADEKWFKSMYDLRHQWIPAYFRDFYMGGLFRTTSMSESKNSFFRRYFNRSSNLLAFFMNFESAMDAQRHGQDQLNSADESCFPNMKTSWQLEKHATTMYSISKFKEVQKEIIAARDHCRMMDIMAGSESSVYKIGDSIYGVFYVVHNIADNNITCGCKQFVRTGLLCCHILYVLKNIKIERIPAEYIVARWTKKARAACGADVGPLSSNEMDDKMIINQLQSEFYRRIGMFEGNLDHMQRYLNGMKELINTIKPADDVVSSKSDRNTLFERYYGSSNPSDISILPLDPVKTKGSGSRLKSRKRGGD